MKTILLLALIALFALPDSNDAKDAKKAGRVIGKFTVNQCIRSADKTRLFISVHHYQTKGPMHIRDKSLTSIEVDGKKYKCRHTDGFATESQSSCRNHVDEFVFHIKRDNILKLKNAKKVKFHFEMTYNAKDYRLDETLDIVDIGPLATH